ncbi:MAG: hypothetical protein WBO04_01380 [Steroidobacteraceae bacterium]
MQFLARAFVVLSCALVLAGCGDGGDSSGSGAAPIVVNSLLDSASPPTGTVTLRSALTAAADRAARARGPGRR